MPYKIITQNDWLKEINNIRYWLYENVGEPYSHWVTEWVNGGKVAVKFIRESDAVLFALRWS